MRIGTVSSLYARCGDENYKRIKAIGYDTVDFQMANTSAELYALEERDFINHLTQMRAEIEGCGLKVNQVHGPWPVPKDHDEGMASMKKSIRGAAALGSKYWIIHPMMPYGTEEKGTDNEAKTWQYNIEVFKELLAEAKAYGVVICLENMPFLKFSISTPAEILHLVEEINDDNFKICLDTGHEQCYNRGKDMLALYGDKLCHTHFNDNLGSRGEAITWFDDLHYTMGDGIVDWKNVMKRRRNTGYDGIIMCELTRLGREGYAPYETYSRMTTEEFARFALERARAVVTL